MIGGLSLVNHANAQQVGSYLIDLNSGTVTNLGGRGTTAVAINDTGQVGGHFETSEGALHAFITGPSGMGMTDLGTLGGNNSLAFDVSDAGQVVGDSLTAEVNTTHAFITDPDGVSIRDLGVLRSGDRQSSAWGINNDGQAAGYSGTLEGNFRAFITGTDGEGMLDLNSLVDLPGVVLTNATDINNNGQVIAVGVIPEPETYALMLAGLGLVGFIATRRKSNILLG